MQKINYQLQLEDTIKDIIKNKLRPKLLLHSCCGPCSTYVIEYLVPYFDISVFYYNPNIFPQEEYEKRKSEQIRYLNELNSGGNNVSFIDVDYDSRDFDIVKEGRENQREGGERCFCCYKLRLEKTAKKAISGNFDYFTTTLTVSPYKNAQKINTIGKELEEKYNIKYLYSDFKKKEGYKKSILISKEHDLYRQHYCGCESSLKQAMEQQHKSFDI